MKKFFIVLIALFLLAGFAQGADWSESGKMQFRPEAGDSNVIRGLDTSGNTVFNVDTSGNVTVNTGSVSASEIADAVKSVDIPLTSFTFENTGAPLSTSSTPGLEVDDYATNITYADGELSKIQVMVQVPDNYVSGGAFKLLLTDSDTDDTPLQVDFDVRVYRDGALISGGTNQTPVALSATVGPTPDVVTLTPAIDLASLAAGDWILLRIWRDNVATGASDLEIKGAKFFCTVNQ